MKFPKLKHTVLCQILLYLPGLLFFLWIAALAALPDAWTENRSVLIIGGLLTGAFSLWYLIHNFALLMFADCYFCMVRQWKKDRAEYRTFRNGTDREQIYHTVSRRCARWGKRLDAPMGKTNVEVYYKHSSSWTYFWSIIEKRVAICSTDTLTAEQYRALTGQARLALSKAPDGKIRFKTKSERKAPRARANVVILLADTVEDEVKALARKHMEKNNEFCILPCVVQCSDGCYYTNCSSEYYEQGMTPRPVENFAAVMLRKLVFSRHLPKENRSTQPEYELSYELDMSLWEYCRVFGDMVHDAEDELKNDRAKAFTRMRNGEVRIGEGIVRYKKDNKLAEYSFWPDDEDEMLITLDPDEVWYYKKDDGFFLRIAFRSDLNRRKMKKGEAEQVQKCMETALIAEGYRIEDI